MNVKKSSYNVSSRDRHTRNSHHDTWQLQKIPGLLERPPLTSQGNQHKVWTQLNSEQSKATVNQWPMQDFMRLAQTEEYGSQSRNNRGHSPEEPNSKLFCYFFFVLTTNDTWRNGWLTYVMFAIFAVTIHSYSPYLQLGDCLPICGHPFLSMTFLDCSSENQTSAKYLPGAEALQQCRRLSKSSCCVCRHFHRVKKRKLICSLILRHNWKQKIRVQLRHHAQSLRTSTCAN